MKNGNTKLDLNFSCCMLSHIVIKILNKDVQNQITDLCDTDQVIKELYKVI